MELPRLTILNNSVKVDIFELNLKDLLRELCSTLTTVQVSRPSKGRPIVTTINGRYYHLAKNEKSARFPITYVHKILEAFARRGYNREQLIFSDKQHHNVTKFRYRMDPKWKPRKYQTRYIKAISGQSANRAHLVDLDMGMGKTLIGSFACHNNEYKIGILVRSRYVSKWMTDIRKYIKMTDEELFIIRGMAAISRLEDMTKEELDKIQVFIMSIRTIALFITAYLEDPDKFEITPLNLLERINVGTVLNDESHQEFEGLLKCIMFLNPYRLIGLSGTMESDDAKMNYIYSLLFPPQFRAANLVEYVKYINMKSYTYYIRNAKRLRFKTHMGYNHNMFEKSLMKLPSALENYKKFMLHLVKTEYLKYRVPKDQDRCILFFSTVDMCTIVKDYLKKNLPDLDVRRYTGDDPYENIIEANITTTTPGSAGTAVDIPNLITAIQTVSIGSKQLNEQVACRLRELDNKIVRYITTHSLDIESQKKLHIRRKMALKKRIINNMDINYPEVI